MLIHELRVALKKIAAQPGKVIQFGKLLKAEGRPCFVGDKAIGQVFKDEHAVVLDTIHILEKATVALLLMGAVQIFLGGASPAAQHQSPVPELVVIHAYHAAISQAGDDVIDREAGNADVGPFAAGAAPEGASQGVGAVLDQQQAVAVGDFPQPVPVGHAAHQVGDQHRPGPGSDHALNQLQVHLIGVFLHIHEGRNEAGVDDAGDIGAEGQRRGDDLRATGDVQQPHGQHQRRTAGVDHHAMPMAHEPGALLFHGYHVLAHRQAIAHHLHDRVHFLLIVHGAAVADLSLGHELHALMVGSQLSQ